MLEELRSRSAGEGLRLGLYVGLSALAASQLLLLLGDGRSLADPLPSVLFLGAFMRSLRSGLIYLDWESPLRHLLFLAATAGVTGALAAIRSRPEGERGARVGGRLAIAVNALWVAGNETDAFVVLFYYLMAAGLSVAAGGWLAVGAYRLFGHWPHE